MLNKLVSLYKSFLRPYWLVRHILIIVLEISLLPYRFCEYCLFVFRYEKLFSLVEVQNYHHKCIRNSDAVNMTRSRTIFLNYIKMIELLINNCLVRQIQGECTILFNQIDCSFFKNEFNLILFNFNFFFLIFNLRSPRAVYIR